MLSDLKKSAMDYKIPVYNAARDGSLTTLKVSTTIFLLYKVYFHFLVLMSYMLYRNINHAMLDILS